MELNNKLFELFLDKASKVSVQTLSIGLGYTAVATSDGGTGIAYTYFDDKKSCSIVKNYYDFEGRPAIELLEGIKSSDTIRRSAALALINSLNCETARSLPEERNDVLFESVGVSRGTRVAMVGFFGPLMKYFEEKEAVLKVIDDHRDMGDKDVFRQSLCNWAQILVLTSTSILNNTTETILKSAGKKVKTIMLGPSTPMVESAFEHLPIHVLAGMVSLDNENVLKAIRHGTGTPVIQKFCKKVSLNLSPKNQEMDVN